MKRIAGVIAAVIALATVGHAVNNAGNGTPNTSAGKSVSSTGLTGNTNYIMDVNSALVPGGSQGDHISAQINVASGTYPTATFKDGQQSTGSITVVTNTAIGGAAGTDTLTVSISSALVPSAGFALINIASNPVSGMTGSSVTIVDNGVTYAFVMGTDFSLGTSSVTTATNLAATIQAKIPDVTATVSFGTVTVTCNLPGSFCDNYTIQSGTIAYRVRNFQNGYDSATFTLNGVPFVQGQQWFADVLTASNTAVSIKNAANLATSVTNVTASTTAATVVTLTCSSSGTLCNAYTLVTSTKALLPGAATFSGGQGQAAITIGPFILQEGTTQGPFTWALGANAGATAINISSAIMNTPSVAAVLKSTTVGGGAIIYTTSVFDGAAYNYALSVSTPALTVLGPALFGGIDPAYVLNTPTITLTATNFVTGLQVMYSTATSGGIGIGGLLYGTTFYVGVIDSNHVGLATTLANSQAGTFVSLGSSRTTTTSNSYTLAPLTIAGTPTFTWQASDDGVNFVNVSSNTYGSAIAAVSFPSPYTATSYLWDFGQFNHRYLNLKTVAPTAGGEVFSLYLNVKD